MVEQFGLAIIPVSVYFDISSPLTSGTINGIFFSYLKNDVLSITIVLFFVAMLAYFFDISPPAEKSAI